MQGSNSFVFDGYALIGYLEDESFSDQIQHILTQAKNSGDSRLRRSNRLKDGDTRPNLPFNKKTLNCYSGKTIRALRCKALRVICYQLFVKEHGRAEGKEG